MAGENEGPKVNVVMWVVTVIPLLVVLLRIYCKYSISKRLGWDDWTVIVSGVSSLSFLGPFQRFG